MEFAISEHDMCMIITLFDADPDLLGVRNGT
jgi:hypothetical protein